MGISDANVWDSDFHEFLRAGGSRKRSEEGSGDQRRGLGWSGPGGWRG